MSVRGLQGLAAAGGGLLLALAGACGGDNVDKPRLNARTVIQVSPARVFTTPGQKVAFTATQSRTGRLLWSVSPASAGSIDADGLFQAGATPEACTVVAAWAPNPGYSGSSTVEILAQPQAAHLNPNLSEADGGPQASADGTLRNQVVLGEDVVASKAASPDGQMVLRHGFIPAVGP